MKTPQDMYEMDALYLKLTGPSIKIKRAETHIADLNDMLNVRIYELDLYTLTPKVHPESGNNLLHIDVKLKPQIAAALLVGEIVHNLRSAMDFAWHLALEERCPSAIREQTKFPIFKTREELKGGIEGVLKDKSAATTELINFLLNDAKSYETGNPALHGLNRLSITDKHQLLIPAFQFMSISDVVIENDEGARIGPFRIAGIDTNGYIPIPLAGKLTVKEQGKPSLKIFFGKGMAFHDEPIVPTLERVAKEVTRTLKSLYVLLDIKAPFDLFDVWPGTNS